MNAPATPPPVSSATVAAFRAASEEIQTSVTNAIVQHGTTVAHHGSQAADVVGQGMAWTLKGIDTALAFHTVELLGEQMRWAMDRLPVDAVEPGHVLVHLRFLREAVESGVPAPYAEEVMAYVDWMIEYQLSLIEATR